ncbi:MAG: ROK family protein [Armatimonadota bacterium]|nr:MAG: ROK family protein [Armatimonadota bacterium]
MAQLKPNPKAQYVAGVDIGGTNVRAGILDKQAHILCDARRPALADQGMPKTLEQVVEALREAMAEHGITAQDLCGIGMGVPGLHDSPQGICHFSPNFADCRDVAVTEPVQAALGVATFMLNDVKTATLGEYRFGAGKGARHMVMITLGTGIGGGVVSDGELRLGSTEGFAEVGHMVIEVNGPKCGCGNHGCWEALAGRDAIIDRAIVKLQTGRESLLGERIEYDISRVTPALIVECASEGDGLCVEVMAETGHYVGVGLTNLITLYNPEVLVVGGGIAQAGEVLLAPARRVVAARAMMVPASSARIVPAELGDDAGIVGASVLVMREMERGA